jgi:hypothetical protein
MPNPDLHYFRRPPDPAHPIPAHSALEPLSTWQAVGLILVGFLVGLLVAFSAVWWYLAVHRH